MVKGIIFKLHQVGFRWFIVIRIGRPDHIGEFGLIDDINDTPVQCKIKLGQFFQHCIHQVRQFIGMLHGHGSWPYFFQSQLNFFFPGLGFCFLQIKEASIGLLKYTTEAFKNIPFIWHSFIRNEHEVTMWKIHDMKNLKGWQCDAFCCESFDNLSNNG